MNCNNILRWHLYIPNNSLREEYMKYKRWMVTYSWMIMAISHISIWIYLIIDKSGKNDEISHILPILSCLIVLILSICLSFKYVQSLHASGVMALLAYGLFLIS